MEDDEESAEVGGTDNFGDEGPVGGLDDRGETICKMADEGVLDSWLLSSSGSSSSATSSSLSTGDACGEVKVDE